MDLKKTFGTDKTLETDGAWFDVGSGARVKVARANSPEYRTELARLLKPHRAAVRAGNIEPEAFDRCVTMAMAAAILRDWEGLSIGDEVIEYSRANALKVLTDYPDFRDLVAELADQRDAYLAAEVEAGKATSKK